MQVGSIQYEFERKFRDMDERPYEYGIVTAYDAEGRVLWSHQSDFFDVTELDSCVGIGPASYGYLVVEGYSVVCLDLQTGEELWRNRDFLGGGATFCFDEEERLCLSGYYGPELLILDQNGKTVARYEKLTENQDLFWTTIKGFEDGRILIEYDSGCGRPGSTAIVDPHSLKWEFR